VTRGKIADYDGNQKLPQIEWSGAPIEIIYVDCGRTSQVNEAWYRVFSPSLIPDISLLIMQDWRTHRERPRLSYNETYWFTAAHPELEIVPRGKGRRHCRLSLPGQAMIAAPLAGCARISAFQSGRAGAKAGFLDLRVLVAEVIAMLVVAGRRP